MDARVSTTDQSGWDASSTARSNSSVGRVGSLARYTHSRIAMLNVSGIGSSAALPVVRSLANKRETGFGEATPIFYDARCHRFTPTLTGRTATEEPTVKTFKARILIGGKGSSIEVQIQAKSVGDAKKLLLAQYPAGTRVTTGPTEVR